MRPKFILTESRPTYVHWKVPEGLILDDGIVSQLEIRMRKVPQSNQIAPVWPSDLIWTQRLRFMNHSFLVLHEEMIPESCLMIFLEKAA